MSSYDEHLISMAGGDGDVLDQIQRRADKATPGPWKLWGMAVMSDPVGNSNLDDAHMIATTADPDRGLRTFNADFIAHAREDVPALLALVREQQAQLESVRALVAEWESLAGPGTEREKVFGPQKVSVEFAVCQIRAALEPTP